MADFYTGCTTYMRFLAEGTCAKNLTEISKIFKKAREHREKCSQCIALNTPLEEQLFKTKVVICSPKSSEN